MGKWLSVLIFFVLLLSGCETEELNKPSPSKLDSEKSAANQTVNGKGLNSQSIVPLKVKEADFQFIIDWETDETLLFVERKNSRSIVSAYDLLSGVKKEVYVSDEPIVSAQLSPSREYLLIHSASTAYKALLTVIRLPGQQIVFQEEIESKEVHYEWNGYDETKILVSAFYEDWSFRSYLIDIEKRSLQEMNLSQPFAVWLKQSRFLYLDWGNDEPRITAPLTIYENGNEKHVKNEEKFYYIDGWKNFLLAIAPSDKDPSKAIFHFYDHELQPLYSFEIPHLTDFSGWIIPTYDLAGKNFFIIEPKKSGEADLYNDGFRLVKRNIKSGKEEVILKSVESAPLLCSPKGKSCLTGNLYEHIIFINEKKMASVIEFE